MDRGDARILIDEPGILKVTFEGEALQSTWLLERKNSNWHVRRGAPPAALPGPSARPEAEKARAVVVEVKDAYREACHKAGVVSEYEGGRNANLSEKVSFLVEKTDKGVRVMVKGQPKTEEVIPLAVLKESINKTAYAYTDKHVGPKEEVGNKGGGLSNRLRAVLNA